MQDFLRRLAASSVAILVLTLLLAYAFAPGFRYLVVGFVACLGGIALWEYFQFAKAKGGQMLFPLLLSALITGVLSFYIAVRMPSLHSLPLAVFFFWFVLLFAFHFRDKAGAVVDLAVSTFGLLYIAVPLGMLVAILYSQQEDGRWWLLYLLLVTKVTDIGAYFGGKLWGKRKLAPQISPAKTIEGAGIGLACSLSFSYGFVLLSRYWDIQGFEMSAAQSLAMGLLFGALGSFGDLAESLLKRDADKKDSNALPGLGGVLDAIDSLLFNIPVLYYYLNFLK